MGGFLPFPNVPEYPGVPALTRKVSVAIAKTPVLATALGALENVLVQALQQAPRWGLFDQEGNQLGINPNSQSTLQAIASSFLSQPGPVLSTWGVDYSRETRISDFPIEQGQFANYNKVQMPANPTVTLILDGSENDRTAFLEAIEDACISTDLYNVVTPEIIYANYNVERYTYSRRAQRGATLLIVDISLKEIRQVLPAFSTVQIISPLNAASTPEVSGGITQAAAPETSTLKGLVNKLPSLSSLLGGK